MQEPGANEDLLSIILVSVKRLPILFVLEFAGRLGRKHAGGVCKGFRAPDPVGQRE